MDTTTLPIHFDDDIIWLTVSKYKLFLAGDRVGLDALLLYTHLQFTCRMQKTNQVWAKNVYLRNGLRMGKDRLRAAKKYLIACGLITEEPNREAGTGLIKGWYIRVTGSSSPCVEKTDRRLNPSGGSQPTNALTNNIKCLNKEYKEKKAVHSGSLEGQPSFPSASPPLYGPDGPAGGKPIGSPSLKQTRKFSAEAELVLAGVGPRYRATLASRDAATVEKVLVDISKKLGAGIIETVNPAYIEKAFERESRKSKKIKKGARPAVDGIVPKPNNRIDDTYTKAEWEKFNWDYQCHCGTIIDPWKKECPSCKVIFDWSQLSSKDFKSQGVA